MLDTARGFGFRTDGGWVGDSTEWLVRLEPLDGRTRIVQSYNIVSLPRGAELVICLTVSAHEDRVSALTADLVRLGQRARSPRASTSP